MPKHAVGPNLRKRKKSGGKRGAKRKPSVRTSAVTLTLAEWRRMSLDVASSIKWTVDNDNSGNRGEALAFLAEWRKSLSAEITEMHTDASDDARISIERPIDDWPWIAGLAFRGVCKGQWGKLVHQHSVAQFAGEL